MSRSRSAIEIKAEEIYEVLCALVVIVINILCGILVIGVSFFMCIITIGLVTGKF